MINNANSGYELFKAIQKGDPERVSEIINNFKPDFKSIKDSTAENNFGFILQEKNPIILSAKNHTIFYEVSRAYFNYCDEKTLARSFCEAASQGNLKTVQYFFNEYPRVANNKISEAANNALCNNKTDIAMFLLEKEEYVHIDIKLNNNNSSSTNKNNYHTGSKKSESPISNYSIFPRYADPFDDAFIKQTFNSPNTLESYPSESDEYKGPSFIPPSDMSSSDSDIDEINQILLQTALADSDSDDEAFQTKKMPKYS